MIYTASPNLAKLVSKSCYFSPNLLKARFDLLLFPLVMAEGQKIGGYQCEFVGPVPEELLCKSCKLVARQPRIVDCCGEHFCQACIDPVLKDKKPCPSCGEADFNEVFIKKDLKKILALQVHCAMKQKGCEWVGQLEQLDAAHLDTDCQYVDVECPSKCDQKVQKRNLATHVEMDCHKREFMCPYCTYKATFEIVSNVHWLECLLFPLKCPNRCGVTCEREFIDDHMQICSLEEVECEVSFAGCKEKFLREDQDEHMKRNVEGHLKLTATATLRNKQELQEKGCEIKQELKKLKQNLEEKDQQIRELQESHKQVQQQLQEKDAELKQELQKKDEALKDNVNQELKKRDTQLKRKDAEMNLELTKRDNELKAKLETTDQNTSKAIQAQDKRLQEQLKAQDGEVTKLQEKDKQFEQKLQDKDAELKQELQKKDGAMKALKDDMNQELKKRDDELKLKLEEKDQQARVSAAEVTALKKQLQQTDQKFTAVCDTLSTTCLPTYHMTMANYAGLRYGLVDWWHSDYFYTHPGGYWCLIKVHARGLNEGRGTHVSVLLCSLPGQFDDYLPWPAKATFTLQLLNQHRDQDHVTVTKSFVWKKTIKDDCAGDFSLTFISHAELGWNAGKQTQYLKDNSLRFRITRIDLHK